MTQNRRRLATLLLLAIAAMLAFSENCHPAARLAFDLNRGPSTVGSDPDNFVALGPILYFSTDDGIHGRELWRSDGTAAGTRMVADLIKGPAGLPFRSMVNFADILFFITSTDTSDTLYSYDGRQQAPVKIATFPKYGIGELHMVAQRLFMVVSDPEHGAELWTLDGMTPRLVKDINPGRNDSWPTRFAPFNGTMYFSADDGSHGHELWRSDGTEAGTFMVRDICPGECDSFPDGMTTFAGQLVFLAYDGTYGKEIWRSDGTSLGTTLVRDLRPGPWSGVADEQGIFALVKDKLFFVGSFANHGFELGVMNSAFQIRLVKDLAPGQASPYFEVLRAGGDFAFFMASVPGIGEALWKSDGTAAGTKLAVDPEPLDDNRAYITHFRVDGDRAAFQIRGDEGYDYWVSDGTPGGSSKLLSNGHVFDALFVGPRLYLAASENSKDHPGLYVSDPWQSRPHTIKQIRVGNASSSPENLTVRGAFLYFIAGDASGPAIWKTDGTKVWPVQRGAALRLARTSDSVYFVNRAQDLFRIRDDDRIEHIPVSEKVIAKAPMRSIDNLLVFQTGLHLWVTDGTAAGTGPIEGLREADRFERVGNALYALSPDQGIWRIDLAARKAHRLFQTRDSYYYRIRTFRPAGERLYFSVTSNDTYQGRTVFWSTAGTADSNIKLAQINLKLRGLILAYPHWFFIATDHEHGREVWMLDLDTMQSGLVKDLFPGSKGSDPDFIAAVGSSTVFKALKHSLFGSDGTPAGTTSLGPSNPTCATVIGSNVYMSGSMPATGSEPYVTDARHASRLADVYPGPYGSEACEFTLFKGTLYFAATDARHGRELWRLD